MFDNVFVPWEHVFIYRNLEASRDQWWKTPSHLYGNHQAQTRYVTKLRFMLGLAQRLNEMTGNIANPAVQIMMGELASIASIYEGMLLAHEVNGADRRGRRAVAVEDHALFGDGAAVRAQRPHAGDDPRTRGRRVLHGAVVVGRFREPADRARHRALHAGRRHADAKSRIALLRLIWDFIGSEFGSRHQQYEKFYGGASFLVKQNVFRNYDFKRATALVDEALNLPPIAP